MTIWERVSWLGHHLRCSSAEVTLSRSPQEVAADIEDQLRRSFPSPSGEPVLAGSLKGGPVARFRIKVFRHGARVGKLVGTDKSRQAKPSLAGSIAPANGSSVVRYRVDASATAITFFVLSIVAVALAIVGGVTGQPLGGFLWIVAVVIAAFPIQILWSVASAVADESFLLDWLTRFIQSRP